MTDEDIQKRAVEIAHKHTGNCIYRSSVMQHSPSCRALAKSVAAAMRDIPWVCRGPECVQQSERQGGSGCLCSGDMLTSPGGQGRMGCK